LGDNPLRPNSSEFGNHTPMQATKKATKRSGVLMREYWNVPV